MADNSYDDQYKGFSLKALTLQYGTSEEDMKDLIDACLIFDKNKSGNIDKNELKEYTKILYAQARLIEGLPIDNPTEMSNLMCDIMADK